LILKRMKRRHSRAEAIALTDRLRAVRPDMAFGADIIAGFPTETEAHFENSVRLVEECGLSFLHVFPYSPRPGTPAARMPQLDQAVIRARAARLREVGEAALARHLTNYEGRIVEALVERGRSARLPDFTPVRFERDPGGAGRPVRARIVRQDGKQLIGALTA
jgi:threonylcarbamoyladenosine tRNA methylthiotransferase MtaB